MKKESAKKNKTIFQIAREELGLSRAGATKYIPDNPNFPGMPGIPEYRLARLESGDATIQPADVIAMAKRYNRPELRNYYCSNICEIGRLDTPKVTLDTNIHEILVNMAVTLRNVNHNKIRLMEILKDETLSGEEQEDFDKIYAELEQISRMIEALQLWCEKVKIKNNGE